MKTPPLWWRRLLCRLLDHQPVRGAWSPAQTTLEVHQLDGAVVRRQVTARLYVVTCARCTASLSPHLVLTANPETPMPARPPLEATTDRRQSRDAYGHVWQHGDSWLYPCLGCGIEQATPAALQDCPSPYSRPESIEGLLVEIRDLLRALYDHLAIPPRG